MALLPSLAACSWATPLLVQGCVGALVQLRGWRQLSTSPAKPVATHCNADGRAVSDIAAAAAAAKCRSKPPRQHFHITVAPLGVKSTRGALYAALHTKTAALVQQLLPHEDVARAAIQALQAQQHGWGTGLDISKNPRYLGNRPELRNVSHSKMRQAVSYHPTLLPNCGITPDDFTAHIHLDHLIPQSLGGPDHPSNLVLMEASRNRYFGADLTAEKVQEVGMQTMLDATEFYVWFHKRALGPAVHQALLQQLRRLRDSCRASRAVLPLAGRVINGQQLLMRA